MAFRYTKPQILADWRSWFANRKDDAEYKRRIYDIYFPMAETAGELDVVEEMLDDVMETVRRLGEYAKSHCPLAFFKPSWEQAQVLNAWHPDYEPEIAPDGYRSICLFCGNQIGKTCVSVVNTLLWTTANNPDWPLFKTEFVDPPRYNIPDVPESGIARPSRGTYRILRRPDYDRWIRTGKMYLVDDQPPMSGGDIWHGVENDGAWNDKVLQEYFKWLPKDWLARRPDGSLAVYKQERRIESRGGHRITGKTFNSDLQDWAGKAGLRMLNIDEGIPPNLLREGLMRIGGNGIFFWPFTPVEPRNIGQRAKAAWDVFKGKLKLVGTAKFFLDFSMLDAPTQVMDAQKKADNLARLKGTDGEDKIRREGGFFNSSPNVFLNFDRERNILPIDGPEVLLAIRGVPVERWREEFGLMRAQTLEAALYEANIVRGMDEGLANPTACAWEAILRTGEYLILREFEASGLAVSDRAISIIDRTGNKRVLQNPGVASDRQRWREEVPTDGTGMKIRRTFADSKMFVRDELMPRDNWVENYTRAGLKLERAGNIGPAARCDYVNDMLRADPTRKHLLDANKNGARLYVTRDCPKVIERFENYLWQQIASGQRAGEFTDKPEAKDDHTVDAFCYPAISKMRWRDPQEQAAESVRYDSMTGAVIR